ncbi:hypothetical protein [Adhaeribacter aquaticus]|uniref:hypothetical protein n=1 Tax=Adhaeribacter aquaticus TaxID=299567 RepID=UPI0003FA57DC|nr:hypothetical protein [Adhaeribacter aquaticus]
MKKLILSSFMLASVLVATAQTNSTESHIQVGVYNPSRVSTPEEVRQLANQLELNEGQYVKLRDLMRSRQEQISQINSMYANDAQMRERRLQAIQQNFDSNLAQAISPKQFNSYLALTGRATDTQSGGTLEMGAVNRAGGATTDSANFATPGMGTNSTDFSGTTSGEVKVTDDKVKVESGSNELKVKRNKEKAKTSSAEYKADADEAKFKTNDGAYKAKSERGKAKLETPNGKVKVEDDKFKMETKNKKIKVKE